MEPESGLSQKLPPPTNLERLNEFYASHIQKYWEAWYPLIAASVIGVVIWSCNIGEAEYEGLLKDAVPQAVTVAAILAGFQGTIHAILLSMLNSRVILGLRKAKSYDQLIHFVARGTFSLIFFVIIALVAIGLASGHVSIMGVVPNWVASSLANLVHAAHLPEKKPAFATALLAGLFTYSMAASVRVMRLIIKMLRVPERNGAVQRPTVIG